MFSRKLTLTLIFSCVNIACTEYSKDDYLKDYSDFVDEVSLRASQLETDGEWKHYDEQYEHFSKDMRVKYSDRLSAEDKLYLMKLKAKYYALRYEQSFKDSLVKARDFFVETPDKVNDYFENDFEADADIVIRNAKELGTQVKKTFSKTVDEIKARHD